MLKGDMESPRRTFSFVHLNAFLCILVCVVQVSYAHVGLTFPPARKYDLDFLDNVRTKPPCGMPKGSTKTSLVSGSSINVTWHLSYPHQGGYRLELMDSQERQVLDLTPKKGNEDYIRGDPTAQWYLAKLPATFTCEDCTIRLLREASEWSGQYRFWSCSDVDIVEQKNYKETCSGHGKPIAGRCVCVKGFWGKRCQYEDECETDSECTGGNGKCIDLGGTALPRKQCFCNPGFHGEKCAKRNLVRLPDSKKPLDLTQHTKKVLSSRMTLFYKVIPSKIVAYKEIEFVLEIEGTSYGALGWRPASFKKSCQRWPFIANSTLDRHGKSANLQVSPSEPKPEAEAEPEAASSKPEPGAAEADPKPEGEPEPAAETEPKPGSSTKTPRRYDHSHDAHHEHDAAEHEAAAAAEPKPITEAEPVPEGEPKPETKAEADDSKIEPKAEPAAPAENETKPDKETESTSTELPKSSAGKLKSKLRLKPKVTEGTEVALDSPAIYVTRQRKQRSPEDPKSEPEPEGEPSSEPEPKSEPAGSASEPEPEGEPQGEPTSPADTYPHAHDGPGDYDPSKLEAHQWTPRADFHAMDCIDLVMGGARGPLSRILDYYTRDRSTPRLDSFWGGKDDITSATGWEKDQKTTLIFRRRVRSTDGPDHSLDGGEMHVIWARGQEPGSYVHSPKSGLEAAGHSPSVPNFYAADEIKYHGHGAQRGKTLIDFFEKKEVPSVDVANCEDSWRHPPGCDNENPAMPCTYVAIWRYLPPEDSVQFTIQSRKAQRWTGIGFGENPTMKNSDAILGWVTAAGRFFLMDAYMKSYVTPALDDAQNIRNGSGTYTDGLVTISFIRPVVSNDPKDVSLDECRFFIFPYEGGAYDAVSKKIGKHDQTPLTSSEKVCIPRKCKPVKVKKPDEVRFGFDIKLTGGFANGWIPPQKGTPEFTEFGNRLRRDLESQLMKIDGFNRLQLTDVRKVGNEAVASLELMVKPNSELSIQENVKEALKKTISTGRAGALQVDPSYLELSAPQVLKSPEEDTSEGLFPTLIGPRLWIVIGCVAALILLAIAQAGLTLYKTSGKTSSHKDSPSGSGMAWRDYSEVNYGYDAYDEKSFQGGNNMPLTAVPVPAANYYNGAQSHITNMSLPRPQSQSKAGGNRSQAHHSHHHHPTHSHHQATPTPNGNHPSSSGNGMSQNNPDFYFMPSQRKYSGEVVRVYVDHNKR